MKIVGITGNIELAVGLRCSGIECDCIKEGNVLEKIKHISSENDIGIIIITEDLYNVEKKEIDNFRAKNKMPLIVKL